MTTQYELFEKTTQERFDEWVHTPYGGEIANKFIRLAVGVKRRGFDHYSAQGIIEKLRWHHDMKHGANAEDKFKISHCWRSYLSRFAMAKVPELKEFFRTREQGSKKKSSHAVIVPIHR